MIYKPNLKKRIVATLLDYTIFLIPSYVYISFFGYDNDEGGKTLSGLMALPFPAYWFLYFVVVEAYYGATFAHQALDLKVLTVSRKKISFSEAFKRHILDMIDIFFYGIPAIIATKNSEKHQRLGDMWAKTIVVDTKDIDQYIPERLLKV